MPSAHPVPKKVVLLLWSFNYFAFAVCAVVLLILNLSYGYIGSQISREVEVTGSTSNCGFGKPDGSSCDSSARATFYSDYWIQCDSTEPRYILCLYEGVDHVYIDVDCGIRSHSNCVSRSFFEAQGGSSKSSFAFTIAGAVLNIIVAIHILAILYNYTELRLLYLSLVPAFCFLVAFVCSFGVMSNSETGMSDVELGARTYWLGGLAAFSVLGSLNLIVALKKYYKQVDGLTTVVSAIKVSIDGEEEEEEPVGEGAEEQEVAEGIIYTVPLVEMRDGRAANEHQEKFKRNPSENVESYEGSNELLEEESDSDIVVPEY